MADDAPTGATAGDVAPAAAMAAEPSPFAKLEPGADGALPHAAVDAGRGMAAAPARLDLVFDVPVCLSVELGRTDVSIRDVVSLGRGSIIELDRGPGAPLDVRVNGVLIGRGEVVLVNAERLGLRFVEVVTPSDSAKRAG
jgi:flagellar motor switch protein FliN/FliY